MAMGKVITFDGISRFFECDTEFIFSIAIKFFTHQITQSINLMGEFFHALNDGIQGERAQGEVHQLPRCNQRCHIG